MAYYSFQKRKITFLELKFKANQSFSFGSFVAITVKINDINPHYPGKEIREAKKISNITDRVLGGSPKDSQIFHTGRNCASCHALLPPTDYVFQTEPYSTSETT